MVRCTIELVPQGDETKKRTIGLVEIANDGTGSSLRGSYKVILRKIPPWKGALKQEWKSALIGDLGEDEAIMSGNIEGFNRLIRGPYDLLFRALKAVGLDTRNR